MLKAMTSTTGRLLQKLKHRPLFIVLILIIIYATYFSYYTILKHQTFNSYAYDLGIYMQYMWTTLNGHGILSAPGVGASSFGLHFQPILFLILPLYAISPRAETLLVLQTLVLALGALPIYWLAKDELGAKFGVAFAGLYLLYPALHGINSFDFHPVALAIPILLFCFYMFKKKHYKRAIVLAVLAMMCKENVALVVMFIGFYWLWIERGRGTSSLDWRSQLRRREVIYPLCLSLSVVICFVLAVYVFIPHFNSTGEYPFFTLYGYNNILGNLFANLHIKLWYLVFLFGPLLFTSLLNPPALLIGLPIFAQNLLSSRSATYQIGFQYPALLIPWLFIASIYGIKWLLTTQGKSIETIRNKFLYILLPYAVVMALLLSPSPIALRQIMPRLTSHHTNLQQAISLIPEDTSIYTQNNLFPHICQRLHAYTSLPCPVLDFFEFYGGNYDYILVDSASEQSILERGNAESLERLKREYGIYAQGDGIYLFKKGYDGEPLTLGEK